MGRTLTEEEEEEVAKVYIRNSPEKGEDITKKRHTEIKDDNKS